jgi:hypothetical protein
MTINYQSQQIGSSVKTIYSYYASSSIDIGMCVCFDEARVGEMKCEWVKPSPAGAKAFVGIAITSASANSIVQIQHAGYVAYALVSGSVDCGVGLVPSETDDGVLINSSLPATRDHTRPGISMTTANETGIYSIDVWMLPTAM